MFQKRQPHLPRQRPNPLRSLNLPKLKRFRSANGYGKPFFQKKTLHALLALGIFLLFTAAISFVVWGWQNFSAPLRVAIPTALYRYFLRAGLVRTDKKQHYTAPGFALSAIAALLIPIDFYTVYVNFNIPPASWPSFWFVASASCLVAYIITTFIIRSRFFWISGCGCCR